MTAKYISLETLEKDMDLKNLTPGVDLNVNRLTVPDINRPALQLTGYFEHFANERLQVIGNVEFSYLQHLDMETRTKVYEDFISHDVPCVVFSSMEEPGEELIALGEKHQVPTFKTTKTSSAFTAEVIRWMNVKLAPTISIHGVLVDIYGEGVLIMGESGIGKSEAALELIKRGHRLISDDVVQISRVSDVELIGTSPDITRHFIELRGIGIIDVKTLFGVESVENTHSIDLVIKLEEWDKDKVYDRLGLEEEYTEFLGNRIVCHSLPIRPGRNLAVICETAAVNHRQKKMGYNAAQELYKRVQANLAKKRAEHASED
ncbi:MAG: HPr(Ser) kinase/phosphatase [Eubacterium sp.]|nr:HPr(Ser) kinase/phosphatase [Eubacterium sp.]